MRPHTPDIYYSFLPGSGNVRKTSLLKVPITIYYFDDYQGDSVTTSLTLDIISRKGYALYKTVYGKNIIVSKCFRIISGGDNIMIGRHTSEND